MSLKIISKKTKMNLTRIMLFSLTLMKKVVMKDLFQIRIILLSPKI